MAGDFAFGLSPYAFFIVAFIVTAAVTAAGFASARLLVRTSQADDGPLNTALSAIFFIVGLVLSFSFSFALNRYDERWHLTVQEGDAIRSAYLRSGALLQADRANVRTALSEYVQARIEYYQNELNPGVQQRALDKSLKLQRRMWEIVTHELAERNAANLSLLTQAVSQVIDVGADQSAAQSFRLQGPALTVLVFIALVGAFLIGLGFGRRGPPQWLVSGIFALLLVVLVFVIVDLDSPRSGFLRVNLQPLTDVQHMMQEG